MSESNSEYRDILIEIGETVVDNFINEGLFKDLPILNIGFSILKITSSFSDQILLRKVLLFIKELNFKSKQEVEDFKANYLQDENYKKIGSQILLILDKADHELKIKWLAKILRVYVDGYLTISEISRLSIIINSCFPEDMGKIVVFKNLQEITTYNKFVEPDVLDHLFSIGLLESHGFDGGTLTSAPDSGTIYALNHFGSLFLKYII